MSGPAVSAPGKAFLCGEYAVTEGARAIVAAVNRRVAAWWRGTGDGYPQGPEATAAFAEARTEFGPAPRPPVLDRRPLFHGETKLGLGSSAAGAVAVAGAVAEYQGHDLRDSSVRDRVFEVALRAHTLVAPEGSGADVATAALGGFISFQRSGDGRGRVEPVRAPESLVLSLIWTGTSVRTSDLLRQVKRLRASDPSAYHSVMSALHAGADEFAAAFVDGRIDALIEAARAYHEAMGALGGAAGAPIVDRRLAQIAQAATREGGAAKPCGAGGGDVAVAFFDDPNAAQRFEAHCTKSGLEPIEVNWGAEGVRAEH